MIENSCPFVTIVPAPPSGAARYVVFHPMPMRRFMQRFLLGALCALPLLAISPRAMRGQTITTGALQGVVRADSLDPLADVAVTLTASEGGAVRSLTTTHSGVFRFALLAPGTYSVLLERLGYRPKRIDGVQVQGGNVQLEV